MLKKSILMIVRFLTSLRWFVNPVVYGGYTVTLLQPELVNKRYLRALLQPTTVDALPPPPPPPPGRSALQTWPILRISGDAAYVLAWAGVWRMAYELLINHLACDLHLGPGFRQENVVKSM